MYLKIAFSVADKRNFRSTTIHNKGSLQWLGKSVLNGWINFVVSWLKRENRELIMITLYERVSQQHSRDSIQWFYLHSNLRACDRLWVCVCAFVCVSLCVSASMWCLCLCVCLWVCGVCVYVCVCEYVVCVFVCLWEHSVCVCVSMCVLSLSVCEREIVCVPVWESVCIYSKPGLSDRRRELQKWVKKDFIEFSFPWEIFTFVIKLLHSPNDMCVCGVCVNVC